MKSFKGRLPGKGVVEVFELDNHPRATFAYAWSYKADDGTTHYVAVLGVSPIDSPADAIRAYIAAQAQKNL